MKFFEPFHQETFTNLDERVTERNRMPFWNAATLPRSTACSDFASSACAWKYLCRVTVVAFLCLQVPQACTPPYLFLHHAASLRKAQNYHCPFFGSPSLSLFHQSLPIPSTWFMRKPAKKVSMFHAFAAGLSEVGRCRNQMWECKEKTKLENLLKNCSGGTDEHLSTPQLFSSCNLFLC